ncbi:myo-inositol 2-dehydrogenase [Fusarium beomiforme]|uniref:Myo-inositol 2-dehydrogenase n=1 Tax=Fusarium beomiforme TaxID=44412 RepID=A0A9P5AXL9_9HYPO|nr:myo-inositol 2-dehydrogenase [Fusarium beomiforme]
MASPKLQVAVAGLGRMGARHALNFHNRTPRAELVAAFTPVQKEADWAKVHLEGVPIYNDYQEMLKHPGLQAVVVATVTTAHAEEAIQAIEADKHVLCEKPLSTSVEIVSCLPSAIEFTMNPNLCCQQSQSVVDAAAKKPHLKVMCGFSRRFDASYRDAFDRMDSGVIGRPSILRSQTCDKLDPSGFFVAYAEFSGGIFVDCNIHDIDLALWYFGADSIVKSVVATGITAVQPELRKHKDVDNGVGIVEFWGGKVAYFYSSRMMAAGQHDMTEIIGTEGKIAINSNPIGNLVEMHEATGIRRQIPGDYYGRFEHAFVQEAHEFTAAVLDNTKLPFKLTGAVQAVKIGCALQESLNSGKKINFDETGRRIEASKL